MLSWKSVRPKKSANPPLFSFFHMTLLERLKAIIRRLRSIQFSEGKIDDTASAAGYAAAGGA
jgi:hypothetical protein